jgi:hypothetical protein
VREITDPLGGAVRDSNPVNHVLSHAFTAMPSFARLDRTTYYETVDILTGCSPVSIPVQPVRSDHHRLDSVYPVVAVQASSGKVRDNFEHVIGEPADVENVLPIDHLCRRVRLKVD